MGSRHQEAALLAASNYIIFHFSQKTSGKMKIHQKISLRNLRTLLPELHLHTSTGKHLCSKWRGYSLNTHPRSQAVHHEISESQYADPNLRRADMHRGACAGPWKAPGNQPRLRKQRVIMIVIGYNEVRDTFESHCPSKCPPTVHMCQLQ